jgi:hypothetical protein
MINRWGHVIQGPRRYSVTAFLTRRWSQLAIDGVLAAQLGPATGVYQHNGTIMYWALPLAPRLSGSGRGPTSQQNLVSAPVTGPFPSEPKLTAGALRDRALA